jgi:hypothetical protein
VAVGDSVDFEFSADTADMPLITDLRKNRAAKTGGKP